MWSLWLDQEGPGLHFRKVLLVGGCLLKGASLEVERPAKRLMVQRREDEV